MASARSLDLLCPLAPFSEAHLPCRLLNTGPVRVSTCASSEPDLGACLARKGVSLLLGGPPSGRAVRTRDPDLNLSFPLLCAHIDAQRCLGPLVQSPGPNPWSPFHLEETIQPFCLLSENPTQCFVIKDGLNPPNPCSPMPRGGSDLQFQSRLSSS